MQYQREADERVRVGLVGAGSHAYRNTLPALNYLPADLVAIADLNADLAERTARQYGARAYQATAEMYNREDLDAVLIVVSPYLHPQLAVEALEAGHHVYMEKPPAASVGGVDQMLAARGDRVVSVGYKKAFMPAAVKARELIDDGTLSPVHTLLAQYPLTAPREFPPPGGKSQWLANGCHPLSFLIAVAGNAVGVTVHRGRDDTGAIIIRHESGAISNLHMASGPPHSQPFERYTIYGGDCSLEIDNTRRVTLQRGIPYKYGRSESFVSEGVSGGALTWEAQDSLNTLENRPEYTQGLVGGLSSFFDCIISQTKPELGSLEFARNVTAAYEAAIASDEAEVEIAHTNR